MASILLAMAFNLSSTRYCAWIQVDSMSKVGQLVARHDNAYLPNHQALKRVN